MERKPSRVVLAGGVFLLAMGIFAACFLSPQGNHSRQAAIITPARPAILATAATLLPPGPPPVAQSIQQPAGAVPDPFAGGPAPKKPKPVKTVPQPLPPRFVLYHMPPPLSSCEGQRPPVRHIVPIAAAPFRYVGLLINSGSGQIMAIVENRTGSHEVRVGDVVDGWHIRGIARDYLTLDDGRGHLWTMEFTGTGDYQYRTRWEPCE